MFEPKEVEVDQYLLDTAHALCENIIHYFLEGKGLEYNQISALCAVSSLTGEAIFSSIHDVPKLQKNLYKEIFVSSPEADKIFYNDTKNFTVYDYIAGLSFEAGASEEDFPEIEDILEQSSEAAKEGRLMPELPMLEEDYPADLPLGFCADNREGTTAFFKEYDISDAHEKITVLALAVGSMIQAISEKDDYSLGQLIETALLIINFSAQIVPFDENYKEKLGLV